MHWDGYPSNHLPLLLAAYQHRFAGDAEALAAHLIDSPAVGWNSLGDDLLDGTPEDIRQNLVGQHGSRPSSAIDDMFTPDGSPAERMTCDESASGQGWLEWAYVLHPHGIEVLPLSESDSGSVVAWDQDPTTPYSDAVRAWLPGRRTPPATTVRKPAPLSKPSAKTAHR
ncbi:hypothetical protein OTB20_18845 [Streptomyces sp. H27-H1]|uniref:hypothetical protein n=1 Tax=Streptomyces sp. H27-H1 TaxID=2996461 RepID=UPI002271CC16|nr:hypothetical protein [Streptomyces sp. H27-H1]MCY0928216.1 hypothetical protein [Streptomyces sp. H27-H1]